MGFKYFKYMVYVRKVGELVLPKTSCYKLHLFLFSVDPSVYKHFSDYLLIRTYTIWGAFLSYISTQFF
jgi:hypothetical protein